MGKPLLSRVSEAALRARMAVAPTPAERAAALRAVFERTARVPYDPDKRLMWDEARDPSGLWSNKYKWNELQRHVLERIWQQHQDKLQGLFTVPQSNGVMRPTAIYPFGNVGTHRHEMTHAINDAAAQRWVNGLPLSSNVTGFLRRNNIPGGLVADELLAHRVGGHSWYPSKFNDYAQYYRKYGHHGDAAIMDALGIAQVMGQIVGRNPVKSGFLASTAFLGGAAGTAMYMTPEEKEAENLTPVQPESNLQNFQSQLELELRRQAEKRKMTNGL